MSGHNNPPILVELTPAMAEFLEKNCEANIMFALPMLQTVSRDAAEKLVQNIENFKSILQAVRKARKE